MVPEGLEGARLDGLGQSYQVVGRERRLQRAQLVQDHAQTPHVRLRVVGRPVADLGRRVERRAEHGP